MRSIRLGTVGLLVACGGAALLAQARGGGAEWLTSRGDAQRTSWIRNDAAISADAVEVTARPGSLPVMYHSRITSRTRSMSASRGMSSPYGS